MPQPTGLQPEGFQSHSGGNFLTPGSNMNWQDPSQNQNQYQYQQYQNQNQ
jgi:hypothetical protein